MTDNRSSAGSAEALMLTDLEKVLLEAARKALNYIENTECELGVNLASGNCLRSAIAKAESASFRCCKGLAPISECGCEKARLT